MSDSSPESLARERSAFAEGMQIYGISHPGHVRSTNQDAFDFYVDGREGVALLVVADGMGGHAGGELASYAATQQAISAFFREGAGPQRTDRDRLVHAVEQANARLTELAISHQDAREMGTTITVAAARSSGVVVASVGDTRAYLCARGGVRQLTIDHSLPGQQNILTRSLGAASNDPTPDICEHVWRAGDALALCTDGAWRYLSERVLSRTLRGRNLEVAVGSLFVRHILRSEADDNATMLVVRRVR